MSLRKRLRYASSVTTGLVAGSVGIGLLATAAPALVYFGGKLMDGLSPAQRKEVLNELLALGQKIQQHCAAVGVDCEECDQYGYGYMLRAEIWEQTLKPEEREAVHHGSKKSMILCPACVSDRLQRPLTPDDFDPKYPINWPIFCAFELVRDKPDFESITQLFDEAKKAHEAEHDEKHKK